MMFSAFVSLLTQKDIQKGQTRVTLQQELLNLYMKVLVFVLHCACVFVLHCACVALCLLAHSYS